MDGVGVGLGVDAHERVPFRVVENRDGGKESGWYGRVR